MNEHKRKSLIILILPEHVQHWRVETRSQLWPQFFIWPVGRVTSTIGAAWFIVGVCAIRRGPVPLSRLSSACNRRAYTSSRWIISKLLFCGLLASSTGGSLMVDQSILSLINWNTRAASSRLYDTWYSLLCFSGCRQIGPWNRVFLNK